MTGRKIIVDTYGGMGRHGGGAFSGKDPTKVDRSAAYMARYVAKNVVASGLAERCEIQLAYAIGVSEPVSIHVDTFGTGQLPDSAIAEIVRKSFPLTPSGIIKHLDLRRPIYRKTASGGHFGRSEPEFTWERTDKAQLLSDDGPPARPARSRWSDGAGSRSCSRILGEGGRQAVRVRAGTRLVWTSPAIGHPLPLARERASWRATNDLSKLHASHVDLG